MALRAVLLLLLVLTALISQHLSKATSSQLGRVRLRRRLVAERGRYLDHEGKASPHTREREGSNQLIQRARRSWLADYLGDVWSHLYANIPRAVLFVFPITLLVLLLLCCLTYVCTSPTLRSPLLWGRFSRAGACWVTALKRPLSPAPGGRGWVHLWPPV
ncbi:Small integral membrane protein 9 isoform X1 [Aix galericulata]|nr:Small integral membrane protein 9 isoform X1 [Aix galericulata]